ncbi:hypothetical protein FJ656_03340 [Schumannella luteola]|uniref:Uncharacterized protein n=1 Tax=Schumannella luteola TaxID=472059 RepID=A0A852YHU2_9MICO|nr:hypothetical protein [Schumannella luteola]NYG99457.1 hypothetical protein [Schumannella luteola]TPX06170.1 hypothetical protein FJ656_03340 [Schumannella luteola]
MIVLCGLGFVASIGVGAVALVDAGKPAIWGTFTETRTELRVGYKGATRTVSFGDWVSDDGARHLDDTELDGEPGKDRTARAYIRPTGTLDGETVVHAEDSGNPMLIVAGVFALLALGSGVARTIEFVHTRREYARISS